MAPVAEPLATTLVVGKTGAVDEFGGENVVHAENRADRVTMRGTFFTAKS
jgi:hypothetical protein